MSESFNPKFQRRNERIDQLSGAISADDLRGLNVNVAPIFHGWKDMFVKGKINGVDIDMRSRKTVASGEVRAEVTLDGNELRSEDARAIYDAIAPAVEAKEDIDREHIQEVWDEAHAENEESDRQNDEYQQEVRPLMDKLLGKKN